MKKSLIVLCFIMLCLVACSNQGLKGDKPPKAMVKIQGETYETVLGTYCWSGKSKSICVDTAGPLELLDEKEPIKVSPGEEVEIIIDFEPSPNEFHLEIYVDESEGQEIPINNNRFIAPSEKGIYLYSYGVWWSDETQENVSLGDAFYAFALEVQ